MSGQFIYVFTEADKEKLLERGFSLIKASENKDVYIFAFEPCSFAEYVDEYVVSNTLTF